MFRGRFALLAAALLLLFGVALAAGSVAIPIEQVVGVLLGGEAERASWTQIVLKFRLPRALTAVLAGAALGMGGLMLQTLFRNPLAAPDVLGINAGASLGVALVVLAVGGVGTTVLAGVSFLSDLSLAAAASLGAALTLGLVLLAARRARSTLTLLILGLMLGQLVFALVSLLLFFSIPERIQAYVNWGFGSFGAVTPDQLPILAAAVLGGVLLSAALVKPLNALLLGEVVAESLGVNVRRVRRVVIAAAALLTGAVTAFCGPIGFMGIAVPHLARAFFRSADHRTLLPGCALLGAVAALAAAIVAELPGSSLVLPLNAVLALFGAPVVIWVVARRMTGGAAL